MSTNYHRCGAQATDENALHDCVTELDNPTGEGFWVVCTTHDTLINPVEIFTATVEAKNVGWGSDPLKTVNAYLPRTFQASEEDGMITIIGTNHDELTNYVLPRLASGNIFAKEVK